MKIINLIILALFIIPASIIGGMLNKRMGEAKMEKKDCVCDVPKPDGIVRAKESLPYEEYEECLVCGGCVLRQ